MKKFLVAAALAAALVSCTDLSYDLMRIDQRMTVLPGIRVDLDETVTVEADSAWTFFTDSMTVVKDTVTLSRIGLDLSRWKLEYLHVNSVEIGYRFSNPFPVSLMAESPDESLYSLEMSPLEAGTAASPRNMEGVIRLSSKKDLLRIGDLPVVLTLEKNPGPENEFEGEFSFTLMWISFPSGVGVSFL